MLLIVDFTFVVLIIVFIILGVTISYYIYSFFKSHKSSSDERLLFNSVKEDSANVFDQIVIDLKDYKFEYIFNDFKKVYTKVIKIDQEYIVNLSIKVNDHVYLIVDFKSDGFSYYIKESNLSKEFSFEKGNFSYGDYKSKDNIYEYINNLAKEGSKKYL